MDKNYYQIDNITIEEAAIRAITRVANTYSPGFLVDCAKVAGLILPNVPGESKYFVEYDSDTLKKLPVTYILRKNMWKQYVKKHVREPFANYFANLTNRTTQNVIEQWGVNCYNMLRNLDEQYD